ncbi:MAG TPA: immunoglobulin domain-containing protein [Verrucomicrobiae bacterium]|nr:immunoglobulin domain-containing protein [Verrucomicrobiae bacterium]
MARAVSLSLSWTYSSTNETGFGVQRTTSTNGTWTQIATVPASTAPSYDDINLNYSTTYYYRVWAYNATQTSPYSSTVSFTTPSAPGTNIAPQITTQPASLTVNAGANVSFSVVATGTAPMSYQWTFNGTKMSGKTNSTLSLTGVQTNQAGNYAVTVTNIAGSATSSSAALSVNVAPQITTQPSSQSVIAGTNVTFAVVATGTAPMSYQWTFNGTKISGKTNSTLSLTGVQTNQAGNYAVTVANIAGSATSSTAVLSVSNVSVAPQITTQPSSQSVTAGSNVTFTVAATGTVPMSYQWTFNGTKMSGKTNSTLSLTGVQTNQAGNYAVTVANVAGSATSSAAVLSVNVAPQITTQPSSQSVAAGSNVTFTVAVSGTKPMSYQWLFNGAKMSGKTSSVLSLTGVQSNQLGSYSVTVSNVAGNIKSQNAVLTMLAPDKIKPTVSIETPKSGSHVSNAVVTVTGKAGDNVGVTGVYYSLNGGSWLSAAGLTNWSASVTLLPGTNVLQAYAVDAIGNTSSTSKVTFLDVVLEPLTVNIAGKGTITPNYNGKLLDVGVNYSMTVQSSPGFAFTNWTGSFTTNSKTLKFRMTTNLQFTANFVDVQKPTVSIETPKSGSHVSNAVVTVTGKAGDNVGVTGVYYSLNGGSWVSAAGLTNWSASVTLIPGTNVLQAYAVDAIGNTSSTSKVTFTYEMTPTAIAGMTAVVTPSGSSTFYLSFGSGTFSQNSTDTNNFNGVGNYTYKKLSASAAQLVIDYTAPPTLTNEGASLLLTFNTNGTYTGVFSNADNSGDTGDVVFSNAPNLAPSSLENKKIVVVNDFGEKIDVALGDNGVLKITNADNTVDSGKYSFKRYSPIGALVVATIPGQNTNYLQLTFSATDFGDFFVTSYDDSTNLPQTDYGTFGVMSQAKGGNAPDSLQDLNAQVNVLGGLFSLNFSANTFAQNSSDPNFDNGVGNYTYTTVNTNAAWLSLNYTAPLSITNESGSVYITFVSTNFGIFTNQFNGTNSIATIGLTPASH